MMQHGPPYPALAVANYFIDAARLEAEEMTQMKLQKLVYIAQGWHLAISGEPLISDNIEAWKFGPVIRSLHSASSPYGRSTIREPLRPLFHPTNAPLEVRDELTLRFLSQVWSIYKKYSAFQLSMMTHQPDSPWSQTYTTHESGSVIKVPVIKEYYKRLLEERVVPAAAQGRSSSSMPAA